MRMPARFEQVRLSADVHRCPRAARPWPCPASDDGDRHAAALRNLSGRLLGCLWHCLITGQHYGEAIAFPAATRLPQAA
jgi:hypothetical protein